MLRLAPLWKVRVPRLPASKILCIQTCLSTSLHTKNFFKAGRGGSVTETEMHFLCSQEEVPWSSLAQFSGLEISIGEHSRIHLLAVNTKWIQPFLSKSANLREIAQFSLLGINIGNIVKILQCPYDHIQLSLSFSLDPIGLNGRTGAGQSWIDEWGVKIFRMVQLLYSGRTSLFLLTIFQTYGEWREF